MLYSWLDACDKYCITALLKHVSLQQTTHSLASQSLQLLQETGKRKADDAEAAALVSDDLIAKRQARFKTQEQTAEEQRKQRFMDPETVRAKERKERFQQWLPGGAAAGSKSSKDAMAAAIGTSLDSSMPAKGRGKGKHGSAAPQEKFSAEFTAKAEVGFFFLCSMCWCALSKCLGFASFLCGPFVLLRSTSQCILGLCSGLFCVKMPSLAGNQAKCIVAPLHVCCVLANTNSLAPAQTHRLAALTLHVVCIPWLACSKPC